MFREMHFYNDENHVAIIILECHLNLRFGTLNLPVDGMFSERMHNVSRFKPLLKRDVRISNRGLE